MPSQVTHWSHSSKEGRRRWRAWIQLGQPGVTTRVSPDDLRRVGLYGGAQGIYLDKEMTASPAFPEGITVSVMHTNSEYPDEFSDAGVRYHYPVTKRPPSRDHGEVEATKNCQRLGVPLLVITRPTPSSSSRLCRWAWVADWNDSTQEFFLSYSKSPVRYDPSFLRQESKLSRDNTEVHVAQTTVAKTVLNQTKVASLEVDQATAIVELPAAQPMEPTDHPRDEAGLASHHALLRWGQAPCPLMPAKLRAVLANRSLPVWFLAEFGLLNNATVKDLGSSVWKGNKDTASIRAQDFVLNLLKFGLNLQNDRLHSLKQPSTVASRRLTAAVTRLTALDRPWPPLLDPLSVPWRIRTVNALRTSGLLENPIALGTVTFGELLALRNMGIKSILDFTCVSEAFFEQSSIAISDVEHDAPMVESPSRPPYDQVDPEIAQGILAKHTGFLRWGQAPCPLVPARLRAVFAHQELPAWLIAELKLPAKATVQDLGWTVWEGDREFVSEDAQDFAASLITQKDSLRFTVTDQPWPPSVDLHSLSWSVRTENVLRTSGLLENPSALETVTYGELLALKNMGRRSVLEFACFVEVILEQVKVLGIDVERLPDEATIQTILARALESDWAEQVSNQDPRFADLLLGDRRTVFAQLDDLTSEVDTDLSSQAILTATVERVEARISELNKLYLEEAASQFLAKLSGYSGRNLEMLIARMGWGGQPKMTLEEVGELFGVTRERVRQIVKKGVRSWPDHALFLPQLDRALELFFQHADLTISAAKQLLHTTGISRGLFHPDSINCIAKDCGRLNTFVITGSQIINSQDQKDPRLAPMKRVVRDQIMRGYANLQSVTDHLVAQGVNIDKDTARRLLRAIASYEFLEGDWFWAPGKTKNRVQNVAEKLLSLTTPIPPSTIKQGLVRVNKSRLSMHEKAWLPPDPPESVLRAFFKTHPDFVLRSEGVIESTKTLDYKSVCSPAEQTFVEVLRASPTGVLDRAAFHRGCVVERGMNEHTFTQYGTHSPILENVAPEMWALRGPELPPSVVKEMRAIQLEQSWLGASDAKRKEQQTLLHQRVLDALGPYALAPNRLDQEALDLDCTPPLLGQLRVYAYRMSENTPHSINVVLSGHTGTGSTAQFDDSGSRLPVLLGYLNTFDLFVLWDALIRQEFSYNHPLALNEKLIHDAIVNGIGFRRMPFSDHNHDGIKEAEVIIACRAANLVQGLTARFSAEHLAHTTTNKGTEPLLNQS